MQKPSTSQSLKEFRIKKGSEIDLLRRIQNILLGNDAVEIDRLFTEPEGELHDFFQFCLRGRESNYSFIQQKDLGEEGITDWHDKSLERVIMGSQEPGKSSPKISCKQQFSTGVEDFLRKLYQLRLSPTAYCYLRQQYEPESNDVIDFTQLHLLFSHSVNRFKKQIIERQDHKFIAIINSFDTYINCCNTIHRLMHIIATDRGTFPDDATNEMLEKKISRDFKDILDEMLACINNLYEYLLNEIRTTDYLHYGRFCNVFTQLPVKSSHLGPTKGLSKIIRIDDAPAIESNPIAYQPDALNSVVILEAYGRRPDKSSHAGNAGGAQRGHEPWCQLISILSQKQPKNLLEQEINYLIDCFALRQILHGQLANMLEQHNRAHSKGVGFHHSKKNFSLSNLISIYYLIKPLLNPLLFACNNIFRSNMERIPATAQIQTEGVDSKILEACQHDADIMRNTLRKLLDFLQQDPSIQKQCFKGYDSLHMNSLLQEETTMIQPVIDNLTEIQATLRARLRFSSPPAAVNPASH